MRETGVDGRAQIAQAVTQGAKLSVEPAAAGYGGMFARNKKVASVCDSAIAYTFGEGDRPADGGTFDTWKQINGSDKVHVSLCRMRDRQHPAPHGLSREEWARRFAARVESAVGVTRIESEQVAHDEIQSWPDAGPDAAWLSESPEAAADQNVLLWGQ
jgi:hypothetical protein